jgi:ATP-dependent Zn protease
MVFFNVNPNESGGGSLVVGKQWWLFFVITIPLTILVFVVWFMWQRHRYKVHSDNLGIDQITELASTLEKGSLTSQV